jgi:N-acetylglutamate synthase-like GNAT family acetyltransferase
LVDYSLREAHESDGASIRKLIHKVGINPVGLDWKRFVIAVTSNGDMVACGQVKPHSRGEILELASIAVAPEYQKQGIARRIIEHLLNVSPRPLYLMCRSPLGPFYEKFGFRNLEQNDMPTYFRRISQLAGLVESLASEGETLLVMKLQ